MADYFRNSYRYVWEDITSLESVKLNQSILLDNEIAFEIPKLVCQASTGTGWFTIAEMNTRTRIYRQETINGVIQPDKTLIREIISGATSFNARNDDVAYITGGNNGILRLRNIQSFNYSKEKYDNIPHRSFNSAFTTFNQIAHASSDYDNKSVVFSTSVLNEDEVIQGKGYYYSIECTCLPDNSNSVIEYLEARHTAQDIVSILFGFTTHKYSGTCSVSYQTANANNIKISTSFYCKDMSNTAEGGPFLMKGVKYNAYQLFRKAMLTVDTQIIDNEITGIDENPLLNGDENPNDIKYSIIIDPKWKNRLKSTQVYETVLEEKNLWEVFQQIGLYLHAEPTLNFAKDGTNRLELSFKQLGKSEPKHGPDVNRKLTIYNSQPLSQYFASFDSYVSNLFSPQTLCREILVPKCADGSYLISNDTSQLETSYNISEIIEFKIYYNGVWKDAMRAQTIQSDNTVVKLSSKIYEKSIYDILTNEYKVSPSKADSLYYTIGSNIIGGLNYIPPHASDVQPMSLKKIVRQLFGVSTNNLKFNELMFEIVYRTQDSVRLTQIRPDMERFVLNSSFEKYPHHEQFYNQLDKIPDSERFSSNMWGQLVRSGNAIIQCQEYCPIGEEKEEGDLFLFDNIPYYITNTENEYFTDIVLQKITYSAYWNEISMITAQNSENRMYEVSEKSSTRREPRLMEFLKLSSVVNNENKPTRFLNNNMWKKFIRHTIFRDINNDENQIEFPNYAYVKFLGDKKRQHTGTYGQFIELDNLFPSSEIDRQDENNIRPKVSKPYSETIVPVLCYPKKDGMLFEFDMFDNFQSGTYVDTSIHGGDTNDNSYFSQQPVRYVDILGRADLYQFNLFHLNKEDLTLSQARQLTKAEATIKPTDANSLVLSPSKVVNNENKKLSIALDKDCRESISFNYQINLLDKDLEFMTFSNLFGEKHSRLKLLLYDKELGMFDQIINLSTGAIVAENVNYSLMDDSALNNIKIQIEQPSNVDLSSVKSLVWYDEHDGIKDIYLVCNVGQLDNESKLRDRYIYPVFTD